MADDVFLLVGGRRYSGWKSIQVTRTIEGLVGSFSLDVSDRWGPDDPWPIAEGDACQVSIDDQVVIDGYVDKRKLRASKESRALTYTGRDRAGDLVDCSLLVPDTSTKGHKWTYRNLDIAQFVTAVAAPHGIRVSVQPGLKLKKDPLLVAHPGETGFEAIKRAAASSGVLVVSDGVGGILITGPGTARSDSLVEGVNILEAEIDYDATDRFARYLISSQPPGTDEASGESVRVQAEATDADVARKNRTLLIRPEKGYDTAGARRRADWEARIRAAKAATATITVQGWKQASGALWTVNTLTHVSAGRLIGIDGEMLISQAEFTIGEGGRVTQLHIVRPDAFTPEPQIAEVSGEGAWKELAKGAL
jgi:prophage tail gpP-like protein